jgi:hypothetical protein
LKKPTRRRVRLEGLRNMRMEIDDNYFDETPVATFLQWTELE